MQAVFVITDAQVVALSYGGEVIVELLPKLSVSEGRNETMHPVKGGEELKEAFNYEMNFWVPDQPEPDNSQQAESFVAITGRLEDGRPAKICGHGYVGRDNLGNVEGSFFTPPVMQSVEAEEAFFDTEDPWKADTPFVQPPSIYARSK